MGGEEKEEEGKGRRRRPASPVNDGCRRAPVASTGVNKAWASSPLAALIWTKGIGETKHERRRRLTKETCGCTWDKDSGGVGSTGTWEAVDENERTRRWISSVSVSLIFFLRMIFSLILVPNFCPSLPLDEIWNGKTP